MKIITILIVLLFTSNSIAFTQETSKKKNRKTTSSLEQTDASKQELDSFWGIKFGSTIQEVEEIMKTKNAIIDEEDSTDEIKIYTNCIFAGRETEYILLYFVNDSFFAAKVGFKEDLDTKTIELYKSIRSELNEKYYPTKLTVEKYKKPYYKGDGFEITAIQTGYAIIQSTWAFCKKDSEKLRGITLQILPNLVVQLSYQDDELLDIALEKEKNKNIQDY